MIRLFGLRRSGNHAIMRWIAANSGAARHIHFDQVRLGQSVFKATSIHLNGAPQDDVRGDPAAARDLAETTAACDLATVFLEEPLLVEGNRALWTRTPGLDRAEATNVFVYRSFINWLASAKRHPNALGRAESWSVADIGLLLGLVDRWKQHTRLAFGDAPDGGLAPITIHYDRWRDERLYRLDRLAALGMTPIAPETPDHVPDFGGGSSFDRLDHDDDPARMATDQRWAHYLDDADFALLLTIILRDPEVAALLARHDGESLRIIERKFGVATPVAAATPETDASNAGPLGLAS